MKSVIAVLALFPFLFACGSEDSQSSDIKIVGGAYGSSSKTQKGSFPSSIGYGTRSGGSCSGVRIAENTYVTAGHCFEGSVSSFQNSIRMSNGLTVPLFIENIQIHPTYSSTISLVTTTSDVATFSVRLDTIAQRNLLNSFTSIASLRSDHVKADEMITITGIGCEKSSFSFVSEKPFIAVTCDISNTSGVVKYAISKVWSDSNITNPFSNRYFTLLGKIDSETNGYIAPGDSGGGDYDSQGKLVGVNATIWGFSGTLAGTIHTWLGYADVTSFLNANSQTPALYFDGLRTLTDPVTGDLYNGEMRNGMKNGLGRINYAVAGKEFNGSFVDDVKTGLGKQIWPSGSKYISYEGTWANDLPDGEGTLKFTEGYTYVGTLKSGKLDGKSVMTYPTGEIREGTYANGKREGEFTLTTVDGKKYLEIYSNDIRTSVTPI